MKQLGQDNGCGRALWENNNDEDSYGTPMALMLLPFWTDGCIGSMEGLYFEASGTTPYHFLTTAALSPAQLQPGAPARSTRTATSTRACSTCRPSASATTSRSARP